MSVVSYFILVVGLLLIAGLNYGLNKATASGSLVRNNLIGIRTYATLSSDAAWITGHKAAMPYVRYSAYVGILGAVVSLVALYLVTRDGTISHNAVYALPITFFIVQLLLLIVASIKANAAAQTVQE
ncbi:SdpI family protein [Corynebacterium ulcerans]|uniref:SdpI family protein n=1 Tax=Corynebacterium ulcerans TaxID=65058 RepID=UPI0005C6082E|nr:SdpI family protein [Corynebacterium ulcerans]